MRDSERKKRNLIIGGLCAVAILMAVGFAVFAQQLQINSTSEVTSTWDVHIKDNGVSYKNAVAATSTLAEKTSALVATFACTLSTPGTSTISYDVIVENKGTLNARLDSINLTGGNTAISVVVSPTNASLSTSPIVLAPNDEATITVTVSYNNINTQPTGAGLSTNITATLNFSQTADSPAPATQTVYSWNTDAITVGTSQLTDLVSTKTTNPYYTSEADIQSALNGKIGSTIYNKYTVEGDTITEGYACQTFGILSQAECLKMSTDGSEFGYDAGGNHTKNVGILRAIQSNSTFIGASGSCSFTSDGSDCSVGNLCLNADVRGDVGAYDYDGYAGCSVHYFGDARCSE